MADPRRGMWIVWAAMLGATAAIAVAAFVLAPRPSPWDAGESAVARFVLTLLALVAGIGTFAVRESLALRDLRSGSLDPTTPAGIVQLRRAFFALWLLCAVIALLGAGLAWGAASPWQAVPFAAAGAALLVLHAPRSWIFERQVPG